MRLLILTQKVDKNDPILGFFHRWIEEFSRHCESVLVICLEEGRYDLPENVRVLSLGKEKGGSRLAYVFNFYRYISRERESYDRVFVHMNPEYVVLGGTLWEMWGKRIALWYVHRQVNLKLRVATLFADDIFSATKESFRLPTKKLHIVGHGIDVDMFERVQPDLSASIDIFHLGRISRIKHIETIMRAVRQLLDDGVAVNALKLAGAPVTKDDAVYKASLITLARELQIDGKVVWDETVSRDHTFTPSTISVNAAPDGGMDKAVLGSLAAGVPCFVTNKSFAPVFGEHWKTCSYSFDDSRELAARIEQFLALPDNQALSGELCEKVRAEYSVEKLIATIYESLLLRHL